MKALQRRNYSFDTRSVMLFAAMSLGSAGALQAQTTSASPQPAPASKTAPQADSSKHSYGPGTGTLSMTATTAFNRADTNKDGQLSEKEAAQLPAISQRFKELDVDQNGALSPAEFEKGLLS